MRYLPPFGVITRGGWPRSYQPKMTGAPGLAPETWDSIRPKHSIPLQKVGGQVVLQHRSIQPENHQPSDENPPGDSRVFSLLPQLAFCALQIITCPGPY